MLASLFARATGTVTTGLVGAVAYDGVRRAVSSGAAREGAVTALAWGLKGKRRAEVGAENLRLVTGDLMAEARARVGEQVPPPGTEAHAHDHDH